ncbi:MAG: ferrous iron transport protein A [Bacteriovoracaceae bacterium]|nr:ferrous iron transport protein A [Bacteriovoracaceae bacterium]
MRLNEAQKKTKYKITTIHDAGEFLDKFNKFGFFPGTMIELKRKAPLFGDPLLVEVESSQYALTKEEAKLVEIVKVGME